MWCVMCKVLITTDSCHVHREVARTMPILRRYSRALYSVYSGAHDVYNVVCDV